MHVLVTTDTVGGVWTYTRELVAGLARRGARVTLVSLGSIPGPRQTGWMEGLSNVEFLPTAFKLEWMQESADDIRSSSDYLSDVIHKKRPDLLHLSQFCYGALKVDIPKVVMAHSDVLSWWAAVHGNRLPDNDWIHRYRETVQRGLDGATMVVSPSCWMLSQIEKHYVCPQRSTVIYNGRSPQLFNPDGEKEDFVLSVGRLWDAAKQTSLLREAGGAWRVVIAGPTEHPDAMYPRDAAPSADLGCIENRGNQNPEQLRALYSSAAVYAATSRYEPFGLAPLEAALSRCALVANDIPSFRELWGETANYFHTNDPESLRKNLTDLRGNRDLRRHYAELSYVRARRAFTADRMVDETLRLFQGLAPVRTLAA